MLIDSLKTENLNDVFIILKQDMFADTEEDWISHFIEDHNCFSLGLYEENKLISILLSEKLSYNGCIIWYIATHPDNQGCGNGSKLLKYFESYVKQFGVDWIFLNATDNSLDFYSKNNFRKFSKVHEHVKDI